MILTEQHLESQVSELLPHIDFVKALIRQLSAMLLVTVAHFQPMSHPGYAACAHDINAPGFVKRVSTFSSQPLIPYYLPFRMSPKEHDTRLP